MTINLGVIFILLHLGALECSELTHIESGVVYNESVIYDPETEDVIVHVPHHERDGEIFRETLKVDNHLLRLSVWREEEGDHCFSRSLMDFEQPLVLSELVEESEANQEVVNSAEMIQVKIWATPQANMTQEEREGLTEDMKQLCHGLPIIKMDTERVDPEEFQQRMSDADNCSLWTGQTGRKKRQAFIRNPDRFEIGGGGGGGLIRQTIRPPRTTTIRPPHTPQTCSTAGGGGGGGGGPRDFLQMLEMQKRSADENSSEEEEENEEASGEDNDSNNTSREIPPRSLIHLIIGHREIACE